MDSEVEYLFSVKLGEIHVTVVGENLKMRRKFSYGVHICLQIDTKIHNLMKSMQWLQRRMLKSALKKILRCSFFVDGPAFVNSMLEIIRKRRTLL